MKEIDAYTPITIEEATKIANHICEMKDNPFTNNLFLIDYDDCRLVDSFCEYYLKEHSKDVMDHFYSEFKRISNIKNNKEINSEKDK